MLYIYRYGHEEKIHAAANRYGDELDEIVGKPRKFSDVVAPSDAAEWTLLNETNNNRPFSVLTERDKLYIFAHGNPTGQMDKSNTLLSAAEVVRQLALFGLVNVGKITFKVCDLGLGQFLNDFLSLCHGTGVVNVGGVKGYNGTAVTSDIGKPYEKVKVGKKKLEGDDRFKFVGHPKFRKVSGKQ